MVDRFGDIPQETENLLRIAALKIYCHDLRIKSVKQKAGIVYMTFTEDTLITVDNVFAIAQKYQRRLSYGKVGEELVIKVTVGSLGAKECLDLVKDVFLDMMAIVEKKQSLV